MDDPLLATGYSELREQLLPWATIPAIIGALAIGLTKGPEADSATAVIEIAVFVLAAAVWQLVYSHRRAAAWTLSIGLWAVIVFAILSLPATNFRHALLLPMVIASITLGWRGCFFMTLLSVGFSFISILLNLYFIYHYEIYIDIFILCFTGLLLIVSERPLRTVVELTWRGYDDARHSLEEARDHQLALKQALEDLALANAQTARLNELLMAARQQVEDARRAKEEFVANVSHELRTPLNMIIGFSDMILEAPGSYSPRLPTDLLADVAAIKRNSQHLASLVDDVLCLAEMDTGPVQLVREPVSIESLVHEAVEAVSVLFAQKGLWIHVNIPEGLPSISCDRTRIRQVLLNILSNAGRFTSAGGATITVRYERGAIQVAVTDTGPGIDPHTIGRLFEPFQQADASIRRRYGGTGLGLAISKRFVEMHGGQIGLDSEEGKGTTVHFCLPLSDPLGDRRISRWFGPYQHYEPRTRRSMAPLQAVTPCVVVVGGAGILGRLMRRYIPGVEIVPVANDREVRDKIDSCGAAAIVVNEAADHSGACLQTLRTADVDVPILTCWVPEPGSAVQGITAEDYLVKPIQRDALIACIDRIAPHARSVLVVDDDSEALQLFSRILASSNRGYEVLNAEQGDEALSILRRRLPDLLLLDLVMPNKDGFAVLEAKALDPLIHSIPTIIISAKDPQREPIISRSMTVTRQEGLSVQELMVLIEGVLQTLRPRFGSTPHLEMPAG